MNILITRPVDQCLSFLNKLSKNKFHPFILPLTEILPVEFHLKEYSFDYIVFTSQNTCKYFLNTLKKFNLEKTQIIAVGTRTADFLRNQGIEVNLIPKEFSSEGLQHLFIEENIKNKKILIPGSTIRDKNFESFCQHNNNYVLSIDIYNTIPIKYKANYIASFIKEYAIDVVTLFSPSAAKSLFDQFNFTIAPTIKYVCIGKRTSRSLKEKGLNPLFPDEFTEDGILNILIKLQRGEIT